MATLIDYLQKAGERGGVAHQIAIEELRRYIALWGEEHVAAEMVKVDDVGLLKYMQEAGLRGGLFHSYLNHLNGLDTGESE